MRSFVIRLESHHIGLSWWVQSHLFVFEAKFEILARNIRIIWSHRLSVHWYAPKEHWEVMPWQVGISLKYSLLFLLSFFRFKIWICFSSQNSVVLLLLVKIQSLKLVLIRDLSPVTTFDILQCHMHFRWLIVLFWVFGNDIVRWVQKSATHTKREETKERSF